MAVISRVRVTRDFWSQTKRLTAYSYFGYILSIFFYAKRLLVYKTNVNLCLCVQQDCQRISALGVVAPSLLSCL